MEIEQLAQDIARIMQWPFEHVLAQVRQEADHPGMSVRNAWNERNPNTPEEIERFYQTTESYIYDLVVEGNRPVRRAWREAILAAIRQLKPAPASVHLLDYGGGAGTDALYFARHGLSVDYYDLPGVTSAFAQARFRDAGQAIRTRHTVEGPYDVIVSLEVLEHLVDPLFHVQRMVQNLKPGGLLLFSEAFDLVGEDYPSHLVRTGDIRSEIEAYLAESGIVQRDVLLERIHVYEKMPAVTVIVPVYNAFDRVQALLASIEALDPAPWVEWLFLNDGSPDGRIAKCLSDFALRHPEVTFRDREQNLGFVATCNEGMTVAGTRDVVLLNSDTVVYPGWLDGLARAAYADDAIGTATPLSNNASIYSVLKGIQPDTQFGDYLRDIREPAVDIPTGVGFCLYIKRQLLESVGMLDPVFGVGYGEETDLCLRASQAGYRHVLTPRAFVYHAGRASMLPAGVVTEDTNTRPENEDIVHRRFPRFRDQVQAFYERGEMTRLKQRVELGYAAWLSQRRPSIAFLLHNPIGAQRIGGTEYHVQDLLAHAAPDIVGYVIAPDNGGYSVEVVVDGHMAPLHTAQGLSRILETLNPSLIHVHHVLGYPAEDLAAVTEGTRPYVVTVHDFYTICPQYTLLAADGTYCNVPEAEVCNTCAIQLFGWGFESIVHHRGQYQALFERAEMVLFPSESARSVIQRVFDLDGVPTAVVPHPFPITAPRTVKPKLPTQLESAATKGHPDHLRVAFIGYSDKHKGTALQEQLIRHLQDAPLDFVFVGGIGVNRSNVRYTGLYERGQLPELLRRYQIQVAVFASPWPETFGYTLSEAWAAGIPVVVGPYGAPAERVRSYGGGWVVETYQVAAFAGQLMALSRDPSQLDAARSAIDSRAFDSPWDAYVALYQRPPQGGTALMDWAPVVPSGAPAHAPAAVSPLIRVGWKLRARVFPVGTRRERAYMAVRRRLFGY